MRSFGESVPPKGGQNCSTRHVSLCQCPRAMSLPRQFPTSPNEHPQLKIETITNGLLAKLICLHYPYQIVYAVGVCVLGCWGVCGVGVGGFVCVWVCLFFYFFPIFFQTESRQGQCVLRNNKLDCTESGGFKYSIKIKDLHEIEMFGTYKHRHENIIALKSGKIIKFLKFENR